MLNLTLTIFELTEAQEEAQRKADEMEINIETKLEECTTASVIFQNIDYVKPVGMYCIVSSGGDLFTINESAESVNEKIKERQSFRFN